MASSEVLIPSNKRVRPHPTQNEALLFEKSSPGKRAYKLSPLDVPAADATSLGAAMFAFLAAGTFRSIEEAQAALAPAYLTVEPDPREVAVYDELYGRFRDVYFNLGNLKSGDGRAAPRATV